MRDVSEQPAGLFTQHTDKFVTDDDDMDSDTATESDLSLKSRSFLHRVNDRLRKMLDHSSTDAMLTSIPQYGECLCLRHWKHLYSWERITQNFYIPSKIQNISQ